MGNYLERLPWMFQVLLSVAIQLQDQGFGENFQLTCWKTRSVAMRREISSSLAGASRHRSALVLIVAAPPDACLVAAPGGAVEPLIHAPEAVQSARIGGIGVVDDAVLERERTHTRPLARVRGHVGSGHGRELLGPLAATL